MMFARLPKKAAYRQALPALAGKGELGYPFNPQAVPTRSAERQVLVDKFAASVLTGSVYTFLKDRKCQWFPSDYDMIARQIATRFGKQEKEILSTFLASVYVCDLAHATLEQIDQDLDDLDGLSGKETTERVYGILANLTGIKASGPEDRENLISGYIENPNDEQRAQLGKAVRTNLMKKPGQLDAWSQLSKILERDQQPPAGVTTHKEDDKDFMYPFAYKLKVSGANRVLSLAHDVWVFKLYDAIRQGKFNTENFSLTSRVHVFAPLGIEVRGVTDAMGRVGFPGDKALAAVKIDEIATFDQTNFAYPKNVTAAVDLLADNVLNGSDVIMNLHRGKYNSTTIKAYEVKTIHAEIGRLVKKATDILADVDVYDLSGSYYDVNKIPMSWPSNPCPGGKTPTFINSLGAIVPGYERADGSWTAPMATDVQCTGGVARGAQRSASARLAQRGPSVASVSLKQVEALPKKELAKFVQRIVNM